MVKTEKKPATVTRSGDDLAIGKDFVDAVCGEAKCHGWVEFRGLNKRFPFVSTLGQDDSYRALTIAGKEDGLKISCFMSQAL